ncbi:MAG: glycosyltransferase [Hyphomicrobiales bacterium]|nr:glycosyltransferase [Hyphomicrobiales bacterium]
MSRRTENERRPLIVWKIRNLKPYSPSVRYRCLFPLLNLRDQGWDSVVLIKGERIADWSKVAALVFVKVYGDEDVELAREAAAAGVPVVFDLCDNIFAQDVSGEDRDVNRLNFLAIAHVCRFVTVPSPALRDSVAPHLSDDVQVRIIPDQVEDQRQTETALDISSWRGNPRGLRRAPLSLRLQRFRSEAKNLWRPVSQGPDDPGPAAPRAEGRFRVIWFGTHGTFGHSGLNVLADICPALERVHAQLPIELLVVSNNEEKFSELIEPFQLPTLYHPWHPIRIFEDIRSADVFVMPNSQEAFSVTKSANRALLSLSLGVPVVATLIPALEPLTDALYVGDWHDALLACLTDADERARRAAAGRAIVEAEFSGRALARRWDAVFRESDSGALKSLKVLKR